MTKMNYENAAIRNNIGENRFNEKLDNVAQKGQDEFFRLYNARQKRHSKNEAELKDTRCKCGSDHIVAVAGTPPHKYKWTCGTCKSFIKWTSNPLSEDILVPAPVVGNGNLST
jgi:hypothetical protein